DSRAAEPEPAVPRENWSHRLTQRTWARRYGLQAVVDCAAWAAALAAAWALVDEADVGVAGILPVILLAGLVQILVGRALRLYGRRYLYGSFSELGATGLSVCATGAVVTAFLWHAPALVLLA